MAKTPYERMLAQPDVPEEVKDSLREGHEGLNPVELRKNIKNYRKKLYSLATPVQGYIVNRFSHGAISFCGIIVQKS